ncbi:MAG TPA: class I SAM-dependent methyltransferase [Pseudacidobacterium sp.]|nr:class I SAM-dependent methyltransferase [Pseudacidobacterium sp.]
MDIKAHWQGIYGTKSPDSVSWYAPHLEMSLRLINHANLSRDAYILDVGGGASTLADDLLTQGYKHIAVLDISEAALNISRKRLGEQAGRIRWIAGDVTSTQLQEHAYDLWHDRAVFHFLTTPEQRAAYIRQLLHTLKPGGHLVLATFASCGPERCSGLEVVRYSTDSLARELGENFYLMESAEEDHITPSGAKQPFLYCRFQIV